MHEQRFLVHNQIRHGFWFNASEEANTCQRRKVKLIRAGYIRQGKSVLKGMPVYFLTEKGFSELATRNLDSSLPLYEPSDDFDRFIRHDLNVTNIRIHFGKLGFKDWTSERILKESVLPQGPLQRIPDGVITTKGFRVAVEYENGLTKGLTRYQEMFDDYAKDDRYFLLLVILGEGEANWFSEYRYDARIIWFLTTKELFTEHSKALIENKRASFQLRDITR